MKNRPVFLFAVFLTAALLLACTGREEKKCLALEKRFDAVLAGAAGTCAKDSDCSCYSPVSVKSRCGGVTDTAAAEKLTEIWDEFEDLRCPRRVHCGPRSCEPACVKGRCSQDVSRILNKGL